MTLDLTQFDVLVDLGAARKLGIYAYNIFGNNLRAHRAAGQLPAEATEETLLAVALTAALRNVNRTQYMQLAMRRSAPLPGVPKPRLVVGTMSYPFAESIRGIVARDTNPRKLRAGRNFIGILFQQLARFRVTMMPNAQDMTALSLTNWAKTQLIDPKLMSNLPTGLWPSVTSRVL